MNSDSLQKKFALLTDATLLAFLVAVIAYGPNNHRVFIPAEIAFVVVFGIRFFVMRYKMTLYTLWSVVSVILSLCSIAYAPDRTIAYHRALSIIQVLAFGNLLVPYIHESGRNQRWFLHALVFAASFIVLRMFLNTPYDTLTSSRWGATIGLNPNQLGYILSIAGLVSFYLFSLDKRKWPYLIMGLALCFFSLFSGSRKDIAILMVGIFLLVFLSQKTYARSFLVLGISIVLAVAVIFLVIYWQPLYQILGRRIATLLAVFTGGETDGSTAVRLEMLVHGWRMFLQKPLFGWGHGAFTAIAGFGFYTHNNYMELLVSVGLLGFLLHYSMVLFLLVKGIKGFGTTVERFQYVLPIMLVGCMLTADLGTVGYMEEFYNILLALCYGSVFLGTKMEGIDLFRLGNKIVEWFRDPRLPLLHPHENRSDLCKSETDD